MKKYTIVKEIRDFTDGNKDRTPMDYDSYDHLIEAETICNQLNKNQTSSIDLATKSNGSGSRVVFYFVRENK